MRWICKEIIEENIDADWRASADSALTLLTSQPNLEEKKKFLSKKASTDIWRTFYSKLPEDYKKKCWYCEAEEIRSDMPVDHFRPKGKVEENELHEGYWWLAFDWENYRCACTFCNSKRNAAKTSGGKGCHFPIFDEQRRAKSPDDDISQEQPAILDPCNPDDDRLIWFDQDGLPEAVGDADEAQSQKVKNSISIFHLNEVKISRKRNKIRLDVRKRVEELSSSDPQTVLSAKSALRRMIRDTEMLSRTAFVYLSQYRHIEEVEKLLNQGA